jgi:signal transduction histidine kinase
MSAEIKTRSLIRQTITIILMAQVLCALLLCGAALLHEWHSRFRAFDVRVQGRSDSLLGAIQDAEDPNDNVKIDPSELQLPVDDVYAVYNRGGRLLGSSANAPASLISRGEDGFRDVRVSGVSYRLLQTEALRVIDREEFGGTGLRRPVTILYASPETQVWREILQAVRFYLITILLVAALSFFLVSLLLRRALQPLSDLATAASSLSAPALYFEPPSSVLEVRELRPLAEVLAATIARLRESFAKEHRFVGDAAHELKTAIAVVRSSVQVLMLRPRSVDEYKSGLERIFEDNRRVEGLVSQMLQLASFEEPPSASEPATDLCEVAALVASRLQHVAEEHSVIIRLENSAARPVGIPSEAAEILISNLLLNAIQHSELGSSVLLATGARDNGVVLELTDHGGGIGPEALPHIFERFYREDSSRSRETGGTGLGLAICKSIVDAASATIEVKSRIGIGTVVKVTFIAV